jgi:hypothetical protein
MSRFIIAALLLVSGTTQAQMPNCLGRPDFDACMQGFIVQQQQGIANSQQQLFQTYVAQNRDMLIRNYQIARQNGTPLSFEQFAYWSLMTRNGQDLEGVHRAQVEQYEGNRRANEARRQGGEDYINGNTVNSQRTDKILYNSDQEGIRGNSPYVDPNTGETRWLPHNTQPNRPFNIGGEIYVLGRDGNYYHRNGNDWVQMDQREGR